MCTPRCRLAGRSVTSPFAAQAAIGKFAYPPFVSRRAAFTKASTASRCPCLDHQKSPSSASIHYGWGGRRRSRALSHFAASQTGARSTVSTTKPSVNKNIMATGSASESAGGKRKRDEALPEDTNPLGKRKVALLVAYNGVGFHGLQKNPDVVTVEETLEQAIHRAGGISDDNAGTLQKVNWSRAGRTDKGVHALGQIISLKMMLPHESILEDINKQLVSAPSPLRVLSFERVNNKFCAHTHCSSREYEYLLPVSVLCPSSDPEGATSSGGANAVAASPFSADDMSRLRALLSTLEGTHSFHNFTDGKMCASDKQAQRYMIRLAPRELIELGGVSYVPLFFHGQSFLMHQIRKMVGLVCATFRGDVPSDAIQQAFSSPRVNTIPMAPSCALILRRAFYDQYERRRHTEGYPDRNSVHFPALEQAKDEFLKTNILPHVASSEGSGEFVAFTEALGLYKLHRPSASITDQASEPPSEADKAALLERWADAKGVKDYATSDRLRDELRALGVNPETEKVLYTDGAALLLREQEHPGADEGERAPARGPRDGAE